MAFGDEEQSPDWSNFIDVADDDGTVYSFDKSTLHSKQDFVDQLTEKRRQKQWLTDPERHTPESSSFEPSNPFLQRWWKGGVLPTGEQWSLNVLKE